MQSDTSPQFHAEQHTTGLWCVVHTATGHTVIPAFADEKTARQMAAAMQTRDDRYIG